MAMDERVLTPEGRAALVDELTHELERGPQPTPTPDPGDEPMGTLLRLLPGGKLEIVEHTPRPDGMSPRVASPTPVPAARPRPVTPADYAHWQDYAVCVEDPKATNAETPAQTSKALAMCARCPVVAQCREWAESERPHFMGVAGGLVYGDDRSKKSHNQREVA